MNNLFPTIMRMPDNVKGATDENFYRFEERDEACPIKYEIKVENGSAKVTVFPSGSPVRYLRLRFNADFSQVEKVYADDWARASMVHPLEWRTIIPDRRMPWFVQLKIGETYACYGVKTGANCFASWYLDSYGITLMLNIGCGNQGTDLKEPIVACEIVECFSNQGENAYEVAERFAGLMCEKPVFPKTPVFGTNNWYWAYGDISEEIVLQETDYLIEMAKGCKNKPYLIIDDGWQLHRKNEGDMSYNGGVWEPNEKFGDMKGLVDKIHAKGALAGLWFRPLLTLGELPEEAILCKGCHGDILDLTHPLVIKKAEEDARRIKEWGFDLIKHDFTTIDTFGNWQDACDIINDKNQWDRDRVFYDNSLPLATALKNLFKAIQKGAGDLDVIGCNVIGHLSAGIHSMHRAGADTSGRVYEITRSHGMNAMMRQPLNKTFYMIDPDCASFTEKVNSELNLDFLEMCAITGVTTLASVKPGILTKEEMKRINEIFLLADKGGYDYVVKNYDKVSCPDTFVSRDGKNEKRFNWYKIHNGARAIFEWVE